MFYMLENGERALIYQDAEGIFATPTLRPLEISLSKIALEPAASQTSQEISFLMRVEANRSDIFDSPYLMTNFANDAYMPMFSFMHTARAFVNEVET